jgi:hypothetical protein
VRLVRKVSPGIALVAVVLGGCGGHAGEGTAMAAIERRLAVEVGPPAKAEQQMARLCARLEAITRRGLRSGLTERDILEIFALVKLLSPFAEVEGRSGLVRLDRTVARLQPRGGVSWVTPEMAADVNSWESVCETTVSGSTLSDGSPHALRALSASSRSAATA